MDLYNSILNMFLICYSTWLSMDNKCYFQWVNINAPPGATKEQIAQVKAYVEGSNKALGAGVLSPTGIVSTMGKLRQEASRAARIEGSLG